MKLQDYLLNGEISEAAFGNQVGVSQVAIHRYVVGQRIPAREIMHKIIAVTDGAVTADDFYSQPETASGAAA